ncbi:MAG TPA: 16S rRNA (guanine(527)-N(7))-methyltransferase RsmG [Baekduia sp.]|nr:16S rRNA (guanine(527)-N(7))-methyltransferase RsmG [Baekduia sp.]
MKRSRITWEARLTEICQQHDLSPPTQDQLRTIVLALEPELASITTVRAPSAAVDVHIADSLSALAVPTVRAGAQIADLGAGGGFPALALAAALPSTRVVAVESVGKKCDFVRNVADAAGLTNMLVVNARAEDWQEGIEGNDIVTARALAPLGVLLEYAAPLLKIGGQLVAYKARRDAEEEAVAGRAAAELGMQLRDVLAVEPFPGSGDRNLHVYEKTTATADKFPRRAGMARKRPLGTAR